MLRHPHGTDLLAYTESLSAKRGAPISAKIAAHVVQCKKCTAEVAAMRRSLEFVQEAVDLEPSAQFTAQLLLAAKNEHQVVQTIPVRGALRQAWAATRGFSYAAGLILAVALSFGAGLRDGSQSLLRDPVAVVALPTTTYLASGALRSPADVRHVASEVETLAAAVNTPSKTPPNQWELEHRRAVTALDADIAAARAALAQNPGCERASQIAASNLERQAKTLRALYAARSL